MTLNLKVVVLGDSNIGAKTGLVRRLIHKQFSSGSKSTMGVEFWRWKTDTDSGPVALGIWDTSGHERFRYLAGAYTKGAHGIICGFDITDESSFAHVDEWIDFANKYALPDAYILLVGHKSDLSDERRVSRKEAEQKAAKYQMRYFETSALTGEGVDETFAHIANVLAKREVTGSPTKPEEIAEKEVIKVQSVGEGANRSECDIGCFLGRFGKNERFVMSVAVGVLSLLVWYLVSLLK